VTALGVTLGAVVVLAGCTPIADEEETASTFPEKDIRLIIQANPGGGSDLSARNLASQLEEILGVSVIPENMPGASGALAMEYVGAQEPDGHVIGFGPVEIAMLNTTQNANVLPENYDFLGQIMLAPGVISVSASSPYETLDDLIEASKDTPLTVANSGAGSIWEAATRGISAETGAQFTPVSYDGGATAVSAAASGEAVAAVSGAGEALAQEGAVRVLAVLNDERYDGFPDVETAEEAIGTELAYGGWGGIYAPAGLPDDVRDILESAVGEAAASDEYQEFQKNAGILVVYRDADEFTEFVDEQFALFQDLLG
jgi:tripartite-type tricarboxylate transporter receptor subunit TctC